MAHCDRLKLRNTENIFQHFPRAPSQSPKPRDVSENILMANHAGQAAEKKKKEEKFNL